jgi:hypothetical protein
LLDNKKVNNLLKKTSDNQKNRSTSPNFNNFMVSNLALTDSIIHQVVKKLKIILKKTRFIFASKFEQKNTRFKEFDLRPINGLYLKPGMDQTETEKYQAKTRKRNFRTRND